MVEPLKLREGFVRAEGPPSEPPPAPEPIPPAPQPPGPKETPPQQPLPSQMKLEPPPIEEPLSIHDLLRKDIAAAPETWPITVALLYKPLRTPEGAELTSLTFREPRAVEINRVGNPTRVLWDGEVLIEERKMTYIMASLSGVLATSIEQMDPRDWNSCAYRLRKFFLPDMRAW